MMKYRERITMIRFIPLVRLHQYSFFIILTLFLFLSLLIISYKNHSIPHEYLSSNPLNETRYQRYCREVDQRIRREKIRTSSVELDSRQAIPYSYSQWRSTPLLPRPITACEHAIFMDLLSTLVEHVFKKHNIQYMMMAATLLGKYFDNQIQEYSIVSGSYTRHDILPWDDDVDIRVSISDRSYLQATILGYFSGEPHSLILMQMHNERNYDKVFFSWCPHTSVVPWRYPFIDIFYHDQNLTHIWLVGKPSDCPVRLRDVFPLVLRPLGTLWLYAPYQPIVHFESRYMVNLETKCFFSAYSHKYERLISDKILYANCSQLNFFYPYVERQCAKQCTEVLKLGDNTIIHTVVYNYAYRAFSYFDVNSSYSPC